MTTHSEPKRVITGHPAQHVLALRGDIISAGTGEHPLIIDRWLRCTLCPTVRVDIIDVRTWRLAGRRYIKDKDTLIEYASSEDNLKARFFAMLDESNLEEMTKDYLRSIGQG